MVLYGSDIMRVKTDAEKGVFEGNRDKPKKRTKPLSKEERLALIRQIAEDRAMLRHERTDRE